MKLAKTWNKKLSGYDLNYNNLPFIGQYFKITTKPIKSSLISNYITYSGGGKKWIEGSKIWEYISEKGRGKICGSAPNYMSYIRELWEKISSLEMLHIQIHANWAQKINFEWAFEHSFILFVSISRQSITRSMHFFASLASWISSKTFPIVVSN